MSEDQEAVPLDPKEAMRQALERKKQGQGQHGPGGPEADRALGHAHGQMGGKRQFRRKAGG
ncbi:DUF5302 family protein [Tessaracoccus flavus]|jgi:hypothetical protein|uniref:Uncharacterized protein n=1 Tax=Tessaracoccus flavus TaxID=1610493 RepID=A0A1Q2CG97_9ACTN|nr:DUF5302 family protein [Tessaracoccus flavus]AQP45136.1 hypothetical protein RPIT_10305 [Tessaracoccus flavus]SDY55416.1 hypothetical protein SAMN05428934_102244 [Tessaracoccus flavus]